MIATSRLLHLIWVFLLQSAVFLFLMIRPTGMFIPHKSQWGSGYFPSWNFATLYLKWKYMKCLRNLTALCTTAGHPGT